jgi:hypothetical protein
LVEARKVAVDKDLSGRIKTLEEKLKGTAVDKKPKDLRRAIGMIWFNALHVVWQDMFHL